MRCIHSSTPVSRARAGRAKDHDINGKDMVQIIEQTEAEKRAVLMECTKEQLVEMLMKEEKYEGIVTTTSTSGEQMIVAAPRPYYPVQLL